MRNNIISRSTVSDGEKEAKYHQRVWKERERKEARIQKSRKPFSIK